MSVINEAIAQKKTKIITSRCRNMVDLCKGVDEKGNLFYFVMIKTGEKAFFVSIDDFSQIAYEFADIVRSLPK